MSESPLKATLKSGTGYDAPWLTVDADTPAELEQRLRGIIDSQVLETVAEAAGIFRATQLTTPQAPAQQRLNPLPADGEGIGQRPQQQSQGWGAAQQQQPQNHPEGKPCGQCGAVLQYKVVNRKSDGKQFRFWACPNQRSRDDGHTTEFAN